MNIHNEHKETIGERIRRLRKERNLPQSFLADATGVTFGWISQIEQDKANASPELLNKIAVALKVPIRELLQDEDQHMELVSRIRLLEVLLETNQTDEAESMIQDLQHEKDLSEKDRIMLSVHLAECRYQQKRYEDALHVLHPIITDLETENHHDAYLLALIRNKIGNAYTQRQDTGNAYYNYKKALDYTSRFSSFNDLAAHISYNVGLTLRRRGRSHDSIHFLERAGEHFQQTKNLKSYAHSLYVQGIAYKNTHDFEKAAELFHQSKQLYQTLNHHSLLYEVQLTIASSITHHHDLQQALRELEECFEHFVKEDDPASIVFVLAKKASLFLDHGHFEECESTLEQATVYVSSVSEILEAGEYHTVLARYRYTKKQFSQSINHSLKSYKIFGRIGMYQDQVNALKLVVDSYRSLGDFEKALHYQSVRSDVLELMNKERI